MMETNDLNNIFGNISPGNRPNISDSNEVFAREWEELQSEIPELDDILIDAKDYPTEGELNDIRIKTNNSGGSNSSFDGLGIMLSIFGVIGLTVALIVNNSDLEPFERNSNALVLKQYKSNLNSSKKASKKAAVLFIEEKIEEVNDELIEITEEEKIEIHNREMASLEFINAKKVDRFIDVQVDVNKRFENYLFDYNYKYMHNFKIYNYESRLAPPETIRIESTTPKFYKWNSYRVPREVIFSNRVYEDKMEKAFKYLDKERYIEVNLILESIIEIFPSDQNAWFYLGISKYRQEDYEGAQFCFEQILEDYPAVFKPESEWYKSLCLLNSGNIDSAKEDLQRIAGRSGFYQKRAASLLANNLK